MENWKKAVIAGSAVGAVVLLMQGRRPAAVLASGLGLAVLASEYPEKFEQIREELPSYVRQGTRLLDVAVRVGTKLGEFAETRGRDMLEELAD